jgi:hypothetical protein
LDLSAAEVNMRLQMNHRVNEFRPIRLDSPRAPGPPLAARGRTAFDSAAPVDLASCVALDASHRRVDESRRMN